MDIEGIKKILLKDKLPEFKKKIEGWNINEFDKFGNNILHYIIKNHEVIGIPIDKLVNEIIHKGIDINAVQSKGYGKSALHLAVFHKLKPVFDILLTAGANIDVKDVNGNTPLWDAVMNYRNDDPFFIKMLIEKGADIKKKNKHGVSPLKLSKTIANYSSAQFFQ